MHKYILTLFCEQLQLDKLDVGLRNLGQIL